MPCSLPAARFKVFLASWHSRSESEDDGGQAGRRDTGEHLDLPLSPLPLSVEVAVLCTSKRDQSTSRRSVRLSLAQEHVKPYTQYLHIFYVLQATYTVACSLVAQSGTISGRAVFSIISSSQRKPGEGSASHLAAMAPTASRAPRFYRQVG